jgi:hypothetical protein
MKPIRVVLVGCCVLVAGGCGAQTSELRTAVSTAGPSVPVNQPSDQFAANPMDAWLKGGQSDASRANNVERKVAACMKQAGLQWTPQIISEGEPSARGALREYRKTKGYGLNTVSNNITSANDPNLAIMKSLGEKELDHYLTVLEGPFVDGDRHGGCRGIPGQSSCGIKCNLRRRSQMDSKVGHFVWHPPDLGILQVPRTPGGLRARRAQLLRK